MSNQVRYPILRRNLKEAAWALSDEDYQARVWEAPTKPPPDNMFPFQEAVAYVLDDMAPDRPSGLVGEVLIDEDELASFDHLAESLVALVESIGPGGSFAVASRSPAWHHVRRAAGALYRRLQKGDGDQDGAPIVAEGD
jgi:hypothetical protein